MKQEYEFALRNLLEPGEEIVWSGYPDVDNVSASLLPFSLFWLSGVFLFAVSLMRSEVGDTTNLLNSLVFILVLVALIAAVELVFVPRRAARTIYVVTNRRVMSLCVTAKLGAEIINYGAADKRLIREDKSSLTMFYLINVPAIVVLISCMNDIVVRLLTKFDPLMLVGFISGVFGWLYPCLRELRIPLPQYRDAPRAIYALDDVYVNMETLPLKEIDSIKSIRLRKNFFNLLVVSKNSGCIRMRSIDSDKEIIALLKKEKREA